MAGFETTVFDRKKFGDILKEIHANQKRRNTQLLSFITDVQPLITDLATAQVILPYIRDYMEIVVRNDEQLVKMAAIAQRMISASAGADVGSMFLTEEERQEIAKQLQAAENELNDSMNTKTDVEDISETLKNIKDGQSEDHSERTEL